METTIAKYNTTVTKYETPVTEIEYAAYGAREPQKHEEVYDGEIFLTEELREKLFQEMEEYVRENIENTWRRQEIMNEIDVEINGRMFTIYWGVWAVFQEGAVYESCDYYQPDDQDEDFIGIADMEYVRAYDEEGYQYKVSNRDEVEKDYDGITLQGEERYEYDFWDD